MAGAEIPDGLEGISIAPILSGESAELPERPLLFHYPHYGQGPRQNPQSALILGDYKILYDWESQSTQLFNLSKDLGEEKDLAKHEPEKAAELLALMNQRLKEIDAGLPEPNPDYDPSAEVPSGRKKR